MKGSRAKKAAEVDSPTKKDGDLVPTPPAEPRNGAARPGPVPACANYVQLPEEVFRKLCNSLRTNELAGAAAADALLEAAGMGPPSSQGKAAGKLRTDVVASRDDSPSKPRKVMGGFADTVDEIPEVEEIPAPAYDGADDDEPPPKEQREPPKLHLTEAQSKIRTKLEMKLMDDIPMVFGVDDSEELDEGLQEDAQACMLAELIAEPDMQKQRQMMSDWLGKAPDADAVQALTDEVLAKVQQIQAMGDVVGGKKKKKKKNAD